MSKKETISQVMARKSKQNTEENKRKLIELSKSVFD